MDNKQILKQLNELKSMIGSDGKSKKRNEGYDPYDDSEMTTDVLNVICYFDLDAQKNMMAVVRGLGKRFGATVAKRTQSVLELEIFDIPVDDHDNVGEFAEKLSSHGYLEESGAYGMVYEW